MSIRAVHNEAALLADLMKGEERAFAGLFDAYHEPLVQYVQQVTGSQEMAIEIVQDVYVKVWMSREELGAIQHFTGYLFILTRNYTLNCLKKMARERKREQQYQQYVYASGVVAETTEQGPDYLSLVERAAAQLPPQQQQVYFLSRKEGLKYAEIADRMGISPATVKKYMQLAMKTITSFVKSHAALF